MQAELSSVADFRSRQVEVEDALVRLREENQGLTEKLDSQRLELERCVCVYRLLTPPVNSIKTQSLACTHT
jgi:hypothetical protein